MTSKGNTNRLTHVQVIAAGKLLQLHCKLKDGHAVYDEGWDDATVRDAVGAVSKDAIRNLRAELIGRIYDKKPKKLDIGSNITPQHPEIGELTDKHNRAMEALSKYFGHELGVDFRSLMVSK